MFKLTVTKDEIQATLKVIEAYEYPEQITLGNIAWHVFMIRLNKSSSYTSKIELRKVRLCIKELRSRGYLIIAKRGYSMAGDDPEPAIHFLNGLYSRAYELTKEADIMYHGMKHKYGDEVSEKIEMVPGQPGLNMHTYDLPDKQSEPIYQKFYNAKGEQVDA